MQNEHKIIIQESEVQKRISELGEEITKVFKGEKLILVCILKGAVMFMVDLAKKINLDVEYEFMEISSYGDSQYSTGVVKINKDLKHPVTDKNVLVIEDIIDTGKTISYLLNHLKAQKPKTMKICSLLDKPQKREVDIVKIDFVGFQLNDEFVYGYGLDNKQLCRNLPFIAVM